VTATLTDNALQVLRARYLTRENGVVVETPEQLFRRVARHVSAAEAALGYGADEVAATCATFERMMSALEFVPNSPTLMNAGRPLGQLAACFVVPVSDSTSGVFEAVRWAAEIQKTGGGTGFSFSRLRPAGDLVASTGGNASGPVSLMQVFDVATEAIKQGGTRRGANMGMLRVDHPDILEFIALKLDATRMRNFNLSVAATDAFMAAVAAGTTYDLINPRTGTVTGQLEARRVFDAIANAAWAIGDPGLVFIDRVNDLHPTPQLGAIEATNPCVTGETLVWVEDRGPVEIRDLVGTTPRIATYDPAADFGRVVFRTATQVVCTGTRKVFRLRTSDGLTLRLTADHRVATERGDIAAEKLERGMRIRAVLAAPPATLTRPSAPIANIAAARARLTDARDGALARLARAADAARAALRGEPRLATDDVTPPHLDGGVAGVAGHGGVAGVAGHGGVAGLRLVPDIAETPRTDVSTTDIGRAEVHPLARAQAATAALVDIPRERLDELVGWTTVVSLEPDGEELVFDLTEPTTSHFFANGLLVHNCGEQPLLPFESCTLGSIDVGRFVATGGFDWDRLRTTIHDSVRFLDDVIEANRYPLVEIERATKATRKIGLGIMGWADALATLDIAYDSEAAVALGDRLASFLEDESLAASRALAQRRGAFPAWDGSRWQTAGERPLRNATTTTIAPTGTISIIAGCASGIEPLYALAYRRNVLDGAELTEVNPSFQRAANAGGFASPALFASVAEHGGVRGNEAVPADVQRRFPTAHEIDVQWHVRMQAAFQRHVHAAVSKTINLRRDATAADVKGAYKLAYELGCKGITVYRDGSREGQVLVTGAREAVVNTAPSCPECSNVLVVQSSCRLCRHCGWSVCG